jgi:hypothetical protein
VGQVLVGKVAYRSPVTLATPPRRGPEDGEQVSAAQSTLVHAELDGLDRIRDAPTEGSKSPIASGAYRLADTVTSLRFAGAARPRPSFGPTDVRFARDLL